MQQRLPEGFDAIWSPCTNGRSITNYLSCLHLPATYQDIHERWKSLGKPALDTLIRHSVFDSKGRGQDGDLDAVIAGQKNYLDLCINSFSILGIELPKRKFEDVALYIHVRAELEAELDVKEYGWSDLVKKHLYEAYWRRSLSSTDIDRAPCLAASNAHMCLYEQIWGEMASMTSEEIHARFESFYGSGSSTASSVMSSSSATSSSSPDEPRAATADVPYNSFFQRVNSSPLEQDWGLADSLSSLSVWRDEQLQNLNLSFCASLGIKSESAQQDILEALTDEMYRGPGSGKGQDDGALFLKQRTLTQPEPKRPRMHRRATSDSATRKRHALGSAPRRLEASGAFVGDMMARFADTYDRFNKCGVADAALHAKLSEIFPLRPTQVDFNQGSTTAASASPKESKRASKRIRLNDKDQFARLSQVADILNTLSQELSSNRKIVDLGARDIQNMSMSSVLRYQHALLDTWHLYRDRWTYLTKSEQDGESCATEEASSVAWPIATLINSLSLAQDTSKEEENVQ